MELESLLSDRMWRLKNLYKCRQEGKGAAIPFNPRPEQEIIFKHLIETPTVPAYIIKSRRLGLSTGICTFQADCSIFESGFRGVLIDQKQEDATKKMIEIIRFSVDNLDPGLLRQIKFDKRNDSELRLRLMQEQETDDSVIFATTGHRGGDCNMLHVSELGPIAATDDARAKEIRSGAFPAARLGRKVVETTWMGGKGGVLWELIKPILERDPNAEGVIYFFPWHDDPEAVKIGGEVTKETEEYFIDLAERLGGKRFSPEQKKWWAGKKLEQGLFMSREYPSTLEEAFRAPIEGAVFAKRIDEARTEGRIRVFPWDRGYPVHTFWDIGSDTNTRVVYAQFIANEIHIIDVDWNQIPFESMAHRVSYMQGKGFHYGNHYLPHDAGSKKEGSKSYQDQLVAAELTGTIVLRRCHEIWPAINKLHEILPRMVFHSERAAHLVAGLEQYHMKKSAVDGHVTDFIVPSWANHVVDALRYLAQAMLDGVLKGHVEIIKNNRPQESRQPKARAGRYTRG